jgi:hypothetical protein
MNRRIAVCLLALPLFSVIGCSGYVSTTPGTDVDVSGTVRGPDGKPLNDVVLYFQPTGGEAMPNQFPLKNGSFSGKMIVGKYTYYLGAPLQTGPSQKKAETILKTMPASWKEGSLDRQIDVSGGTLELKF